LLHKTTKLFIFGEEFRYTFFWLFATLFS